MVIKQAWIEKVAKALRDSGEDFIIRNRRILGVHFILAKETVDLSSIDSDFYEVKQVEANGEKFTFAKIK